MTHPRQTGIIKHINLLIEPNLGACRNAPLLNHLVAHASSFCPTRPASQRIEVVVIVDHPGGRCVHRSCSDSRISGRRRCTHWRR